MVKAFTEGQKINQYTLIKHIGSGGSADVWACVDAKGKQWAIKIFAAERGLDELSRQLFREEFNTTKELINDYILSPLEYGEFERCPFLVSPLCDGSLMDRLNARILNQKVENNEPFFSEIEIAKIIFEVCKGLEYLHLNGIIHNDIKPDNILIITKKIMKNLFYAILV